jgi:hypothetical protein
MTKKEKREQKIRDNPYNVSLEDFEALVNQYGYIREGGKHAKAMIGQRVFAYKRINPVDHEYVEKVLEIIDQMNKRQVNNG